MRKIIHIDMDSFFASVEQRDFPEYRGKPLVVGRRGPRSVVAAASYEARKFGIHSAMPMSVALTRYPNLIVASGRFEVYKQVSEQIQDVFHEYSDLVEPLSLDEAFIDVTVPKKGPDSASLIAKQIKKEIFETTGLTASAGVSYNKFLAKIASDMDKPDGFFLIKPEDAEKFLEELDIGLFFGIGKKTKEKMHKLNIFKGRDLKKYSKQYLIQHFGKPGSYFFNVVRGIDNRLVISHRERKSIGAERTFEIDLYDVNIVKDKLIYVIDKMWERSKAKNKIGKTISMKLRFSDFSTITRSSTLNYYLTKKEVTKTLLNLLPEEEIIKKGVRLVGATLSNFHSESEKYPRQLKIQFNW